MNGALRSAVRAILRAPGFALTATITLAIGIGLATAVFTVANAFLLRPLPVHDQDRLVSLSAARRDGSAPVWALSLTQADEFSRRARTIGEIARVDYYGALPGPVLHNDGITRMRRALVSGNYFDVLGTRAAVGRTLQTDDDAIGAAPVAVLSYSTWTNHFAADSNVIGRDLTMHADGTRYTIVGVAPEGLEYPAGTDFWAPYTPARLRTASDSSLAALTLVGRLQSDAAIRDAGAELSAYLAELPLNSRASLDLNGVATSLPRQILGDVRPAVLIFAAASAILLLITCINVGNLLLVRGLARTREIAVRGALGASRARIATQLVTENAALAIAGGALGAVVANVAVRAFVALAPAGIPLIATVRTDATTVAAAIGISACAMLAFGLVPAFATANADLNEALRSGTRHSGSRRARFAREALVSTQVALAVLVLSAAALIGRSFINLRGANLAFDANRLVLAELSVPRGAYETRDKQLEMLRALLPLVREAPGVVGASPVVAVPFSGAAGWTGRAAIEGQSADDAARNAMFNMELVTPDYFSTFGLSVVRGRAINDSDRAGSEPVIVISEGLARRYWPNQDPIGKRLVMGRTLRALTVVGVVPDTRYRDLREAMPSVYFPLAQSFFPFAPTTLAIRTRDASALVIPSLRQAVAEGAPGVVITSAAPFDAHLAGPLAQPRLNAFLLAVFAVASLALAAIGLFSVMATLVRQQTREMGIRMALGATRHNVEAMLLRRGLRIATVGVAAGIAIAVVANRALGSLLYGVTASNVATLTSVATLLLATAFVSTLIPARAGSRTDPATAVLRSGD
ncbi:MAG TPA: ADOP family duplicated permease [Gemmatimonadaceae bacterium]|nr:ADOP family duplicated permease [Gemmatimonadaceae bacterium]